MNRTTTTPMTGMTLIAAALLIMSAVLPAQRGADAARDARAIEAFMIENLDRAEAMLERNETDKAQAVIDAVFELAPDGEARTRARAMQRQLRADLVRDTVIEGSIVTADERFALNELIEVQLRLTNTGDSNLRIPATVALEDGEGSTLAIATVVFRIYDPRGTMISLENSVRLAIDADIVLAPGASWTTSFIIDPGEHYRSVQAVRTYSVSAILRPTAIELPTEKLYRAISFGAKELTVFPLGWEQVAERPLAFVQEFLTTGMAHELAVALWLVAPEDRRDTVAFLMSALQSAEPAMADAIVAGLGRITGNQERTDASAWLHWWSNAKDRWRPGEAKAPADESTAPAETPAEAPAKEPAKAPAETPPAETPPAETPPATSEEDA